MRSAILFFKQQTKKRLSGFLERIDLCRGLDTAEKALPWRSRVALIEAFGVRGVGRYGTAAAQSRAVMRDIKQVV